MRIKAADWIFIRLCVKRVFSCTFKIESGQVDLNLKTQDYLTLIKQQPARNIK